MQRIVYVPPGKSLQDTDYCVVFELAPPYIIGSVSGTGGADNTIISNSVPGLDGVYVQGIRTESRVITCFIHVDGRDRKDMYDKRFTLIQRLAASDTPGMLYYYNDYTTMRIAAIPQSSPNFTDRIKNYNRADISFYCPSPYWESLIDKSGYMAYTDAGFEFPFEFDISFAALSNETVLLNSGSVPAPLEITIHGPASNPVIINDTTGDKIGLSKELQTGETLVINTKRGNKSVVIHHTDGSIEDAFQYIDPSTEFFSLQPGENRLLYQSDNESEQTQIYIKYRELYVGV